MLVVQCSEVSANLGMFKQQSEWKDSRDFQNCLLYCGCMFTAEGGPLSRVPL